MNEFLEGLFDSRLSWIEVQVLLFIVFNVFSFYLGSRLAKKGAWPKSSQYEDAEFEENGVLKKPSEKSE